MTKTTYVWRDGKLVEKLAEPVIEFIPITGSQAARDLVDQMRAYEEAIFRAFLTPVIRPEPERIIFSWPPEGWVREIFLREMPDLKPITFKIGGWI